MILEKLRSETADAHRALEAEIDIASAVQTREGYQRLLASFWGIYAPLEERLGALRDWPADYQPPPRQKSSLLASDLEMLGILVGESGTPPRCTELPEIVDLESGFGCAYVLEGSALGGRQISRMLAPFPDQERPRRFFTSDGADVPQAWKRFCGELERFASTSAQPQKIIDTATETFTCFRKWMA
jgi:heme oxygenase